MIDLYKAYLSDVQSIGTRYTAANAFYMTIVTALLGVLALGAADKGFSTMRLAITVMVCAFAIIVCWIWRRTMVFYNHLFGAKFKILKAMEKAGNLPMAVFTDEAQMLESQTLLGNEQRVPVIIGVFFGAVIVLSIVFAK